MPYVRQKTWLPLAPRIKGLSVKESPYGFSGLGDVGPGGYESGSEMADLFSTLQGGCFDVSGNSIPCGSATPGLTIVNPLQAPSTQQYAVTGSSVTTPPNSLAAWFQQNQTTVLIGGGLLFGIALLKGFTK